MISFKQFREQTQAQVSASAKLNDTAMPGTNTAAKYAKSVQKKIWKAEKTQLKDVPEIIF